MPRSEDTAYRLILQGMYPRARGCDPRAYFRAKLASLREARKTLLTDVEYAAEREEVFKTIVALAPIPTWLLAVSFVTILGEIAATIYGASTGKWVWVAGAVPPTAYAIWSLNGFRKHHAWLNALSRAQRADIIDYLRGIGLLDEKEASRLFSELENSLRSPT